ncbi:ATP-binding SpoIIE family protein phosphatase [Sphaerisporangium fuscum]|uniref:ATP-binding SpoIIE family protein phosphatase n=1 Tax=Sphaerisporangium fuscum TaxID=2835868 RepID=UPI001BDD8AA2|nr:SpoIIE family protein phosphatase [Sphaerisporangium fuscum]
MRALEAMDDDLTATEVLLAALHHAVATLGGLGGMAHLAGPRGDHTLRLVAITGLPRSLTRTFESIKQDGPAVPARAVRDEALVWSSAADTPSPRPDGTGTVAVPLPGADGPLGVLTVLTLTPGEPSEEQQVFLRTVSRWASDRLRGTSPLWDAAQARAALDRVAGAVRYMSDGFVVMDADGRITFLNLEAERLLGPSRRLLGAVLWELPAITAPDLENRCRRALREGTPNGFDVEWPSDGRCYHLRLVPVPDGLTLFITDVTEKRRREAEELEEARMVAERAAHMGDLTRALASALTLHDVVTVAADRLGPLFDATGLTVHLLEEGRPRLIGLSGYPEEAVDLLDARYPPKINAVSRTLETRAPIFVSSPEEYLRLFPELTELLSVSGKQAWVYLPLIASDRPIGCWCISFSRPRRFPEEERTLLNALSGMIAHALERARLYEAEHARAQELQRGLLPRELPALPALAAAARYLPAGKEMEVGGDWYDIIPLSSERVAVVIGDVMGHGVPEAVTMGRLRTAVHTLADLELPPEEILYHLNDLVTNLGDDSFATCLYALYDPSTRGCTIASAGHPPPAVVHPDGTAHFPDIPVNPPLGAAQPPFETFDMRLPDDALLVLYTDGLVESAVRDIDEGMTLLVRTLAAAWRQSALRPGDEELDRVCDHVTSALLPAEQQTTDDAALLVARIGSLAREDVAAWSLPEHPTAASLGREHVREALSAWGLDDLTMTTELLVSELIGNVVRHAKGPIELRLLRGRSLICEVTDGSLTTPRIRRASPTDEGGRGLQLVAALSQRWGTRYTTEGKCIWTEQPLPGDPSDLDFAMSRLGPLAMLG